MIEIGSIARLQVQRSTMNHAGKPNSWYDTRPLISVPELDVTPQGVIGWTAEGERVVDVHNSMHPKTQARTENAVSVGFTPHYAAMRDRFGPHLVDGVAGENLLVEAERTITLADVENGLVIESRDGQQVQLVRIEIAEPCLKFSRFALGLTPDAEGGRHVTEALQFLREGRRGFFCSYEGESVRVRVGNRLYRR